MKTPTQDEIKEFCQLAGIHWHEVVKTKNYGNSTCTCGFSSSFSGMIVHVKDNNPTFSHPEDVLKAIDEHPKLDEFKTKVGIVYYTRPTCSNPETIVENEYWAIDSEYITEPYALFYKALEWLREEKGNANKS